LDSAGRLTHRCRPDLRLVAEDLSTLRSSSAGLRALQ
jgi:hypothetical protein